MKSWTRPTPDQVTKAVATLARPEQRRYFFDKLQNPAWIEPLRRKGFFASPPQPTRNDVEKTIQFTPWPESKFLARLAADAPDEVSKIFLALPASDNIYVHEDILQAAVNLPISLASKLADLESKWIASQSQLFGIYDDKSVALIRHLLTGQEAHETAVKFAKALLSLSPTTEGNFKKAKSKLDDYSFSQVARSLISPFVDVLGEMGVNFFSDLLDKALSLSNSEFPEDYSYIWRPAIENHERNDLRDSDIGSVLIEVVRDAALQLIKVRPDIADELVRNLYKREWRAFKRIAYFLKKETVSKAGDTLSELIMNRKALEDVGSQHEYGALLERGFAKLSEHHKTQLAGWIREGPSYLKQDDEHYQQRLHKWQHSHLHLIREELGESDFAFYKELVGTYGESSPPDFPYKTSSGWVGPSTPLPAEELVAKSDDELYTLLLDWTPSKEMFSPSRRGLGRALESLMSENPSRMWPLGKKLNQLNPTYVTAILSGLAAALDKKKMVPWDHVIALATWVTQQSTSEGPKLDWDEGDTDWANARRAVTRLVSNGTRSEENEIPFEMRANIWTALVPITKDPDPSPAHEREFGGKNMNPIMLAINSNRGEAIQAVINYALWTKKHLEISGGWNGLASALEVQDVLETHLSIEEDPSIAIRAMYGQWFPWIHLLDSSWATKNKDRIFPKDEGQKIYWEVAWYTYITHVAPYNDMLEALYSQYTRAVEEMGNFTYETDYSADTAERLAEHLIVFVVRGILGLDDLVVTRLFQRASEQLRKHIITFLGRSFDGDDPVPDQIRDRMRDIWEWRLRCIAEGQADATEVRGFGAWFAAKNEQISWVLPQLIKALSINADVDLEFLVLKRLAEASVSMPDEAVHALSFFVLGKTDLLRIGFEKESIRKILESAMNSEQRSRELAKEIVNHFGKFGEHAFRDLLAPTWR